MAEKSIEQKTRAIAGKKTKDGQELGDFQAAQNQLLEIQAQQKQNLQAQRLEDAAVTGKNQVLSQAAMMASQVAAEGNAQAVPAQFTPATQGVLGKYGLTKPQVQKSSKTAKQVITKQNVVVNNNTTNNTTTITQPQSNGIGPLQGRALAFKPAPVKQSDSGLGKFKVWISNIFAKQDQENAIRKREYDRRERNLSRSHGKILKKLESMAQELGEKFDPRKIGSTWSNQLKMLLFLFGFHMLADKWADLLHGVGVIEEKVREIVHWLGFGQQEGKSGLQKTLIKVFGGDPEKESAWEALKNLFVDKERGILPIIGDYVKMWFKERGDAIKEIKFPELPKNGSVLDILKGFGVYLGDILSALVSGKDAVMSSLESGITRDSNTQMQYNGTRDGWKNHSTQTAETGKDIVDENGKKLDDTSYGDAALEADTKGYGKQNTLDSWDLDAKGNLTNNTTAGIKQSRAITSMMKDVESGKVHTSAVITGFQNLSKAAERNGTVLVDPDFVKNLGELFNLGADKDSWEKFIADVDSSKVNYKFIRVPKTDEDYTHEGANVGKAAGEAAASRAIINYGKEAAGVGDSMLADIADWAVTGDVIQSTGGAAAWAGTKAQFKKWASDDNILKLVPSKDPRPGVKINGQVNFEYVPLKKKTIDDLTNRIGKSVGAQDKGDGKYDFTMSNLNTKSVELMDKYLTENVTKPGMQKEADKWQKKIDEATNKSTNGHLAQSKGYWKEQKKKAEDRMKNLQSDAGNYLEARQKAEAIDERYTQEHEEFKERFNNSRLVEGAHNAVDMASKALDSVIEATNSSEIFNWISKTGKGRGKINNNPGNRKGVDRDFGSGTDDKNFTVYRNLEDGYAGNAVLLASYITKTHHYNHTPSHTPPTIREIITEWCPPEAEGNSEEGTKRYIETVAKQTGLGTDTPVQLTKRNLILLELAKGRYDSGIVDKQAAWTGVMKAWEKMGLPDDGSLNGAKNIDELVAMNKVEGSKDIDPGEEKKDVPTSEFNGEEINAQAVAMSAQSQNNQSLYPGNTWTANALQQTGNQLPFSLYQPGQQTANNDTTPFPMRVNSNTDITTGAPWQQPLLAQAPGNPQTSEIKTDIQTVKPDSTVLPGDYTAGFTTTSLTNTGASTQAVAQLTNKIENETPKQTIAITQFTYTPTELPKSEIWNPAKLMPEFQKIVKDDDKAMADIMNKLGLVMDDEVELSQKNLVATAKVVDAVNNLNLGNKEVVNDVDTSYTPNYNANSFRNGIG